MNRTSPITPALSPETAASDPIGHNIDAVVALHAVAERQVDPHQRGVERLTTWLGRPQFLYGILVGVALWMVVNSIAPALGFHQRDDPPFFWLQGGVGLGALLMTTVILITQNRQGKLAERREQLELQMSLLVEQRTAKIIALMEELRRDMPDVHNRIDKEAQALTQVVEPHEVLATLETRLEETMETLAASQIVTEEMDAAALETQQIVQQAKDSLSEQSSLGGVAGKP